MDRESIFDFMDKVTDVVKSASPLATMMGIPFVETIAKWADTAVEVGQNAITRAEEGKVVLTSQDKETIETKIAALHALNDELAEYIANS